MAGMCVYAFLNFSCDIYEDRENDAAKPIEEYSHTWVEDQSLPCLGMDEISIDIRDVGTKQNNISFYAIHQIVKIYVDDELIYSVEPSENNAFGNTPGSVFVSVPILKEDEEKTMTIDLIPVYSSSVDYIPIIYIGDK